MNAEETSKPLSEAKAREVINRWGGEGFFRIRNFGDKIFIQERLFRETFNVELNTHYEERSVRRRTVPYLGGPVDNQGTPPHPWDIKVHPPRPFEQSTETLPLPHTERVQICLDCHGRGQVTCTGCLGRGRNTCPWCHGSGYRTSTVTQTTYDAKGNRVSHQQTVQNPCNCMGGMVTCISCMGKGVRTCSLCSGSGEVKNFDELVVRFRGGRQFEVLNKSPVPENWFPSLTGEVLVDQQEPRIDHFPQVPPEVESCAHACLNESHDVDETQERILTQHLYIERIPITEIHYTYAGVDHNLWICGNEKRVHAPDAPWHRHRLMGLIAGIVLGVAVIVGLVLFFLLRSGQ